MSSVIPARWQGGSGRRVRVHSEVNSDALRRVLKVLTRISQTPIGIVGLRLSQVVIVEPNISVVPFALAISDCLGSPAGLGLGCRVLGALRRRVRREQRGRGRRRPSVFVGERTSGGKRKFDPPRVHLNQRADLEQLQPDRAGGGASKLRVAETDAAHRADEK
jgi:hypothetical protein